MSTTLSEYPGVRLVFKQLISLCGDGPVEFQEAVTGCPLAGNEIAAQRAPFAGGTFCKG